tara:strand:+ start:500 stop:769 length:270 start_codon:yes stop_codon:yes gene_type:complete
MTKTRLGTSYFPTFEAAKAYYSFYFTPNNELNPSAYEVELQLREYVDDKLKAEEIHIGEPPHDYTKGERIEIVNENPGRRYHLFTRDIS